VLDRVLDEGREHHRRHARGEQRRRRIDRGLEPRPHADFLHAEVGRDEIDLLASVVSFSACAAAPAQIAGELPSIARPLRRRSGTAAHVRQGV